MRSKAPRGDGTDHLRYRRHRCCDRSAYACLRADCRALWGARVLGNGGLLCRGVAARPNPARSDRRSRVIVSLERQLSASLLTLSEACVDRQFDRLKPRAAVGFSRWIFSQPATRSSAGCAFPPRRSDAAPGGRADTWRWAGIRNLRTNGTRIPGNRLWRPHRSSAGNARRCHCSPEPGARSDLRRCG